MKLARGGWLMGRGFLAVVLGAGAAVVVGCAADGADAVTDEPAVTSSTEEELRVSDLTDYLIARPDYRRCAAPVCGGFFVRQINKERTRCADGTEQAECYVAHFDGEGMSDAVSGDHVLVRGTIGTSAVHPGYGKIDAREIWVPANGSQATGVAYKLEPTGIRCVRSPCATWIAGRLNATTGLYFSSLGDTFAGDTSAAMAADHALVFGSFHRTTDGGVALAASAAYRKAAAIATGPSVCTADADCTMTAHAKAVTQSSECGCPMCPSYAATTADANARASAYGALCASRQRTCPVAKCAAPRPVACVRGACVAQLTFHGARGAQWLAPPALKSRAGSARLPWVPRCPPGERAARSPGPPTGTQVPRGARVGAAAGSLSFSHVGCGCPPAGGVGERRSPACSAGPKDGERSQGDVLSPGGASHWVPWAQLNETKSLLVPWDKHQAHAASAPGPPGTSTRPTWDKHQAHPRRLGPRLR